MSQNYDNQFKIELELFFRAELCRTADLVFESGVEGRLASTCTQIFLPQTFVVRTNWCTKHIMPHRENENKSKKIHTDKQSYLERDVRHLRSAKLVDIGIRPPAFMRFLSLYA